MESIKQMDHDYINENLAHNAVFIQNHLFYISSEIWRFL